MIGAVREQSFTDGTVSLQQSRGAPCQARDCQCVRFEKSFASNTSAATAATRSRPWSASAARTYGSVNSILLNGLDRAYRPEPVPDELPVQHENIRGSDYYH